MIGLLPILTHISSAPQYAVSPHTFIYIAFYFLLPKRESIPPCDGADTAG